VHRLTAAGAVLAATALVATATAAHGSSGYRFVRPPVVPIERIAANAGGGYDFDVYVRLNRALPRLASGAPNATLELADAGGDTHVSTIGQRAGHCYAAPIDPSFTTSKALRHPKPGAEVKVTLRVGAERVLRVTAHLSRALRAPANAGDAPYARKLGC
jgi:hypothetical protein